MKDQGGVEQRSIVELTHNSTITPKFDSLAVETPIALSYNGQSHAVMMASPMDLEDFALGFSLTERLVDSIDQVLNIDVQRAANGIAINIRIPATLLDRLDQQRRQMSGRSGCGICGISDLAAAIPKLPPLLPAKKPSYDCIERAISVFEQHQPLQQKSGATHAAALFNSRGELLKLREDIGRHNAFDKLIGASIGGSNSLIEADTFALLSSRASHELITKSVIAGIPSLVTISAATTLAVDMAAALNLNLIGFLRGDRQLVYHQNG